MDKAYYKKDITITDPDTGEEFKLSLFKHEKGIMFAVDADFYHNVNSNFIADPLSDRSLNLIQIIK